MGYVKKPEIIKLDRLLLAGMSFFGDPFDTHDAWTSENQIGRLWERLMAFLESHEPILKPLIVPGAGYEVHIAGCETEADGFFEVFTGFQVRSLENCPVELLIKVLPPTAYAVFTFQGREVMEDYYALFLSWLAESDYQTAYPFHFQYYDESFSGMDVIDEAVIDVYFPVKKRS